MARRQQLHDILRSISGVEKVYFQPPNGTQLVYPCIIYKRDAAETSFADNHPYRFTQRYEVTVLDRDPDSAIPGFVAALPMCVFNRHFPADDLNHDVFNLYF